MSRHQFHILFFFSVQDSLYMALAAETLRDLVPPDLLKQFDKEALHYMEDPVRHPEKVKEPCIMKLEVDHAVSFFSISVKPTASTGLMCVCAHVFQDEMVCLNSKVYIAKTNATPERKAMVKKASKGLQHSTNILELGTYRDVLESRMPYTGTNYGFRVQGARVQQYSQQRAALTYFYCKRIVHDDGVTTSPLDLPDTDAAAAT